MQFQEWNQQTLEDLKRAIQEALESGQLFPDDQMQQMLEKLAAMSPEQLDQLLENLVQKLADEGHISTEQDAESHAGPGGGAGQRRRRRGSKSPTNRSIFWASRR